MTATLVGSNTYGFADGNAGHVIDLGSAPSAGQLDVLCVNSNTVVTTPSGFTAAPTHVGGQGAYIYRRIAAGGEGSTVTITTSGDHNTAVVWSRWGNISAVDDAAQTSADSINGTSTPTHTTATLAATNELVIAFGALHSFVSAPISPSWSTGYTALGTASSGTGDTGVVGYVGYKLTAGTAAETPQVSWTNQVSDRYMLTLTFTTTAGGVDVDATRSTTATIAPTAAVDRPATAALAATVAITATVAIDRAATATLTVTATLTASAGQATVQATSTASVAANRTSTPGVT